MVCHCTQLIERLGIPNWKSSSPHYGMFDLHESGVATKDHVGDKICYNSLCIRFEQPLKLAYMYSDCKSWCTPMLKDSIGSLQHVPARVHVFVRNFPKSPVDQHSWSAAYHVIIDEAKRNLKIAMFVGALLSTLHMCFTQALPQS